MVSEKFEWKFSDLFLFRFIVAAAIVAVDHEITQSEASKPMMKTYLSMTRQRQKPWNFIFMLDILFSLRRRRERSKREKNEWMKK